MKLYNLFNEVILEEISKHEGLITETVSDDELKYAIMNRKAINIMYRDYPNKPPSKRYILPQVYGELFNGNYAIRALQISGASKRGNTNGVGKLFRIDRIEGWFPTEMTITANIDDYNPNGDKKYNLGKRTVDDTFKRIIIQGPASVNKKEVNPNDELNNNELNK